MEEVSGVGRGRTLLGPIFSLVLEMPRQTQPAAVLIVNGILSLVTENVFIATVFINEVSDAFKNDVIDRAQFDLLAVAVVMVLPYTVTMTVTGFLAVAHLL